MNFGYAGQISCMVVQEQRII